MDKKVRAGRDIRMEGGLKTGVLWLGGVIRSTHVFRVSCVSLFLLIFLGLFGYSNIRK